jgi:hypothetical protein
VANWSHLGTGNDFCNVGVAIGDAGYRAYGVEHRRYIAFWTGPAGDAAVAVAH